MRAQRFEPQLLDHMGERDRVGHLALKKFAANVGDILYLFGDTLQPRTIDELADYAFDD